MKKWCKFHKCRVNCSKNFFKREVFELKHFSETTCKADKDDSGVWLVSEFELLMKKAIDGRQSRTSKKE